jgi:hypothetical protein
MKLEWRKVNGIWAARRGRWLVRVTRLPYSGRWLWGFDLPPRMYARDVTPYSTAWSARRGCERALARLLAALQDAAAANPETDDAR